MALSDGTTIRVAAHFNVPNASDVVNVYHFYLDSAGDVENSDALDDLLDAVEYMMTPLLTNYAESISLDEIKVWERNDILDRWDYVGAIDGTWAGTVSGAQPLPPGTAPLVTADTVDAHSRGRKYLPPPTEAVVANGVMSTGGLANMLAYLGRLVAVFTTANGDWIPGVYSVVDETFKMFTGTGVVNNVLAYQRRRKPGVGE